MTRRLTPSVWIALAAAALMSWPTLGWSAPPTYIPGQIIVKYKSGVTATQRAGLRAALGGPVIRDLAIINGELVKLDGISVEKGIEIAKQNPQVEYAEPDWEVKIAVIPNDTRFNELWGMHNTGQTGGTAGADISATNAWDVFTGNPSTMVGVIDTGVDYNHPDLAANIWTNALEAAGTPGVDDDGNGYIDDIHGYDFYNNDGDPFDDNDHGTHTSGTIAAVGNNALGVTGVNWTCKIVGIKFLSAGGSGSTAGAIASVQYALAVGLDVTSNSWGGGGFSQALLDAISAAGAANQLFIAAAGNAGSNNDLSPFYPATYNSPYVISVAATDHNDLLASFSNYGLTTVDLGAPGVDVLSCQPGGGYQLMSGTSMATPHVAGVAALIYGRFSGISHAQVRWRIENFADPIPALAGRCVTGARLNAFLSLADPDSVAPAQITDLAASNPGSTTMDLAWTAVGDDGTTGTASRTELRYSTSPIDDTNWSSATLAPTPNPLPAGTAQGTTVSWLGYSTFYYFAIRAYDEWDTAGPVSNLATGTTLGAPAITTSTLALVELLTGGTDTQTLTVSNTGEGRLDFTVSNPVLLKAGQMMPAAQPQQPELVLAKGARDPRVGDPVIAGSGGPDAANYRWIDSDEPVGGPVYSWVEISGVGTPIAFTGDDQNLGPFPIGFTFPFYGNNFTQVRACTNGWLSFTSTATWYTNQGLPNSGSGTPENLVAPFWDDLIFTSAGDAYYYNDGTRFIVEWKDVPHYDGGGPYTFEAILYPSGEIVYQYLSMNPETAGATVGIQNADKTIGLQVAFNTAYVHNSLAVRIRRMPQWLDVAPLSGSVLAGQSVDLTVSYDAAGLLGGTYDGIIPILSNAPTTPTSVPAQLHVIGAPNIAAPASSDFGLTYLGFPGNRTITVTNTGTDDLVVGNIVSSDATVTANPTNFTLGPSESQNVVLTHTPTEPGTLAATVTIQSNDPDMQNWDVAVSGSANDPPNLAALPSAMGATVVQGGSEVQQLTVKNSTWLWAANLDFSVTPSVSKAGRPVEMRPPVESLELGKDQADPRSGQPPQLAAGGGPDAFGYKWADSNEPGGPTFGWVEISGVGTPVNFTIGTRDDGNAPGIPLNFSFPFYGTNYSTVNICTNGWVSFTSTLTTYTNQPLPTSSGYPENLVAGFWDDLDLRASGQCYSYWDGTRFIVEWSNVPHFSTGGPYTFEIILYPSGKIVYQFLSMSSPTNSATVGIQNATRTIALQMVYNGTYVANNLAVRIQRTPEWLSVAPASGSLAGQDEVDLDVTYDASQLTPGTYLGNLHVACNDPDQSALDIPVTLHVTTPTDVEALLPRSFGLTLAGGNPARGAARLMMAIPRPEAVDLRVYNVKGAIVRQLLADVREPGFHPIGWDGRDDQGTPVASGVYFVRMHAGSFDRTLRVTMMR